MIEQFYLTYKWDPSKVILIRVRVDFGMMAIMEYSTLSKALRLELPLDSLTLYTENSLGGGLIPLWKWSRCILQIQPTERPC